MPMMLPPKGPLDPDRPIPADARQDPVIRAATWKDKLAEPVYKGIRGLAELVAGTTLDENIMGAILPLMAAEGKVSKLAKTVAGKKGNFGGKRPPRNVDADGVRAPFRPWTPEEEAWMTGKTDTAPWGETIPTDTPEALDALWRKYHP